MTSNLGLNLGSLRHLYRSGTASPSDVVAEVYDRIRSGPLAPIWISLVSRETALARARALERDPLAAARPLYGIPFAVKDNIDVTGLATTAGCPKYSYLPKQSAAVVEALIDAGAILVGKTNMDQFATGLAGTRSPYGDCSCVFDERYISGGSSSGSAAALASGHVSFALGTDTAGSGRVPAAFNNLVGLKPTRGLLSTRGVVPACRTLDCVSIFTTTCHDAHTVWQAARGFDAADPFSRNRKPGEGAAPWLAGGFRFGVPDDEQLEFLGDEEAAALYYRAVRDVEALGGHRVTIDFSAFRAAGDLLFAGPWGAERYAAIGPFLESHGDQMDPVVREVIASSRYFTAVQVFEAEYRLRELQRTAEAQWAHMDLLLVPTAATIYTHEEVAADPIGLSTNLGYYTSFVNLLDLAAVAVPAGFRAKGLPFGISLIGPAFSDEALLAVADRYHRWHAQPPGPAVSLEFDAPGCVSVAVVGAHLSGEPLNWQLIERGARKVKTCRTAPGYRLYALEHTLPLKPALVRDESYSGQGIEVEVWAVPEDEFGSFVAAVGPPFGIGNAMLDNSESVKCLTCEPGAVAGASEITRFGGWRAYLAQAVFAK
ncbi:MAG TPA: allophanate hydrolase [Bryobacteraceae bacterium]|nr:allophanate hydrolase [Bryobacteraceae bacterium]